MTDLSRYQRAEHAGAKRRGLPRSALLAIVALVVIVVVLALGGGHDPSQLNH